jgi:hypothetical protein
MQKHRTYDAKIAECAKYIVAFLEQQYSKNKMNM